MPATRRSKASARRRYSARISIIAALSLCMRTLAHVRLSLEGGLTLDDPGRAVRFASPQSDAVRSRWPPPMMFEARNWRPASAELVASTEEAKERG